MHTLTRRPAPADLTGTGIDVDTLPLGRGGSRLRADALPGSAWGTDVHAVAQQAGTKVWDRLRVPVCDAAGNRCEACGGAARSGRVRRPECHERWVFDLAAGVQRLDRLVALCPACHETQHLRVAQDRARLPEVLMHLAQVNRWTTDEVVHDARRAESRYVQLVGAWLALDLTVLEGSLTWPGKDRLFWTAEERAALAGG